MGWEASSLDTQMVGCSCLGTNTRIELDASLVGAVAVWVTSTFDALMDFYQGPPLIACYL